MYNKNNNSEHKSLRLIPQNNIQHASTLGPIKGEAFSWIMLVVPGFLAASSPSFSGGDIYIACPFWDSPFKLLVFLRPQVYHRVDKTTYTWIVSLRACGTNGDGSKWRENRVSITIKNTDWDTAGGHVCRWCDVNECRIRDQ